MKQIDAKQVTETVSTLFQKACHFLPDDVLAAIKKAAEKEEAPAAKNALERILENSEVAGREQIPLCQDTGTAVVFLELGQEVHITGGDLYPAVNDGVRRGYDEGCLRKSMVERPYSDRKNTNDNTPAVIYTDIVPGDSLKIAVLPKGGGAENMARLAVLVPADGRQGIVDFVVKTIDEAGGNPCPPIIVGVGIGGTVDQTVMLSKRALMREVGKPNDNSEDADLEAEILAKINDLGVGPMGYGGRTTALAVHLEVRPTHIASLPVAVNIQCHSARHQEAVL